MFVRTVFYESEMGVKKSGTVIFLSGLSAFILGRTVFIPSPSFSIPSKTDFCRKFVLDFCTGLIAKTELPKMLKSIRRKC